MKHHNGKIILSLFDYSGNWSAPYKKAGYRVIQQDMKLGHDIFEDTIPAINEAVVDGKIKVHGILAAVPCTDFASSGARWWKDKDNQPAPYDSKDIHFDDRIEFFTGMVIATLTLIEWLCPTWWSIENPVGRIQKLVPEIGPPKLKFDPCDYGDPYTKRTFLYGDFNPKLIRRPALNLYGSMMHKMSSSQQAKRSITPKGFSNAFFEANP